MKSLIIGLSIITSLTSSALGVDFDKNLDIAIRKAAIATDLKFNCRGSLQKNKSSSLCDQTIRDAIEEGFSDQEIVDSIMRVPNRGDEREALQFEGIEEAIEEVYRNM